MNSKNGIMTFLLVASMGLSLVACGQDKSDHSHDKSTAENNKKVEVGLSISKEKAKQLLSAYIEIKNSLVKTDGSAASESAKTFFSLAKESSDELMKELASDAEHIMETSNPSHQRDHFNTLSDNIYKLVKSTTANETIIYRQYCPMALNNTGAYWLSAEKEVKNPYFGDMMLHCGSVIETIEVQ